MIPSSRSIHSPIFDNVMLVPSITGVVVSVCATGDHAIVRPTSLLSPARYGVYTFLHYGTIEPHRAEITLSVTLAASECTPPGRPSSLFVSDPFFIEDGASGRHATTPYTALICVLGQILSLYSRAMPHTAQPRAHKRVLLASSGVDVVATDNITDALITPPPSTTTPHTFHK